jgi:hypothetical protein
MPVLFALTLAIAVRMPGRRPAVTGHGRVRARS